MKRSIGRWTSVAICLWVSASPSSAQQPLAGDWIGGIDFGGRWQSIQVHITKDQQGLTGTLDLPDQGRMGLPLKQVVASATGVRIEWQGNSGIATYDGKLGNGTLRGQFQQGVTRGAFVLARVARVDPVVYDDYVGSYRVGPDEFIDIGTYDLLTFSNTKTGRTGSLYPLSASTFFSGPSAEIPLPVEIRARFVRTAKGIVTGLEWSANGGRVVRAQKLPHRIEHVEFRSGAATIKGTLILPVSAGRHSAIVKVDPGYSFYPKYGFFPYFFVRQGIAFLTLNARTINGKAAGYEHATFEERAGDAVAGVAMLKARADIVPDRIGLHGSSLSSWVVPLASTLSRDIAFIILRVGSALPVQENILYEIDSDMRQDSFPEEDIVRAKGLRRQLNNTIMSNTGWKSLKAELEKSKNEKWYGYARVGWMLSRNTPPDSAALADLRAPISYDPLPVLQKLTVPTLAINGELDKAVNTVVSVPIMEHALRTAGNRDYRIVVLPHASHDLLEAKTGYNSDYAYAKRHAAGYWPIMSEWLARHVTDKHKTRYVARQRRRPRY